MKCPHQVTRCSMRQAWFTHTVLVVVTTVNTTFYNQLHYIHWSCENFINLSTVQWAESDESWKVKYTPELGVVNVRQDSWFLRWKVDLDWEYHHQEPCLHHWPQQCLQCHHELHQYLGWEGSTAELLVWLWVLPHHSLQLSQQWRGLYIPDWIQVTTWNKL